jgi:PUA domain protein
MRSTLRGSEVKELASKFPFIDKKARIDVVDEAGEKLYYDGEKLVLIEKTGRLFPSLKADVSMLPKAVVDMGAVPFVCKGADVMRPGVKEMDDFAKGTIIIIVDEKNRRPLAVAEALFDSAEARAMASGKVFKNLHYIGDELWKK